MAMTMAEFIAGAAQEEARSNGVPPWNLGGHLNHWSPSSLAMLRRCPYQWQQRYIKGRKEAPGESPVTGTAVHHALERNFGQKIESHEDLPKVELLTWYDDVGWPTTLAIEEARNDQEIVWDTSPDQARARGRLMVSEYREWVTPRIQPLSVEGEFTTDTFGLAVPVIGRFDVTREETVIDIKTGKQARRKPKEDWQIQAAVYAEVEDKPVEFHSVSATKQGKVSVVTPLESEDLLVHPSFAQRERMKIDVRAISAEACLYMAIFGPDEDWPTHGVHHSWACGYCGYRSSCPAWEGR